MPINVTQNGAVVCQGKGALEYTIFMKRHNYSCQSLCSVYRGRSDQICNFKFDAVLIQKVFSQNPQRRQYFMFESAHIYRSKKTSITLDRCQSSFFGFSQKFYVVPPFTHFGATAVV